MNTTSPPFGEILTYPCLPAEASLPAAPNSRVNANFIGFVFLNDLCSKDILAMNGILQTFRPVPFPFSLLS